MSQGLHNTYTSPNVIRLMSQAGERTSVGKPKGKRKLRKNRVKMNLRKKDELL
jgi:hypothetical protein